MTTPSVFSGGTQTHTPLTAEPAAGVPADHAALQAAKELLNENAAGLQEIRLLHPVQDK